MKKIFYFMNVDINWIKQRPHFIAEQLNENFDIIVYYPYFYNRKILVNNELDKNLKTKKIIRIPNALNNNFIRKIFDFFMSKIIIFSIKKEKPDFLFLSSPDHANYIPNNYKGIVVYDCMDDLIALAKTQEQIDRVYKNELKIIKSSDIILVTSNELKKVILNRYNDFISKQVIEVCRNAFNGPIIELKNNKVISDTKKVFKIGYFGTISTWFDFKLLEHSLNTNLNIEYNIVGPITDDVTIPKNKRIKYHSIVKHDKLINFVEDMDCLIMPFEVNDIIKSVDPVKFYEYINFNKNIISVYYEEIERFEPFVYFYNNEEEFVANINKLIKDNSIKYSAKERKEFLELNSWKNRYNQIETILGGNK